MLTSQKRLLLKEALKKSTCPSKNVGASPCSLLYLSESIRGNVRRWWSSWRLSGNFAAIMTSHLSQNSVPHHEGLGKEPKESDASYFWPASFLLKGRLKDVEGFWAVVWNLNEIEAQPQNTYMVVYQCVWTCFCKELMEMIKLGYRCYSPCKWIMWLP